MPSLRSIVGSHSVLRYAALAAFRVASFLARFWRPRAFFPLGIEAMLPRLTTNYSKAGRRIE